MGVFHHDRFIRQRLESVDKLGAPSALDLSYDVVEEFKLKRVCFSHRLSVDNLPTAVPNVTPQRGNPWNDPLDRLSHIKRGVRMGTLIFHIHDQQKSLSGVELD